MNGNKLLAVVGCQRCGTTLMGMILGSLPAITYYDENGLNPVAVYRCEEFRRDTLYSGFKLTTLTPEASRFKKESPGMRFLFMTRDVLATCSSMLRLNWVKPLILGEELQFSINNLHPSDYKSWAIQAFLENDYNLNAHKLAALYIQLRFNFLFEYDAYDLACLQVPYERLVANPEPIIRSISKFLEIDFDPRMLRHHEKFRNLNIHGTDGGRLIDTASLAAYQNHLSPSQIIDILTLANEASVLGSRYYAAFAAHRKQRKVADAIEDYAQHLDEAPAGPPVEESRNPFWFAKAVAALSEREKAIVYLWETGKSLQQIAAGIHTDEASAKVELAALRSKNERLEAYYRHSRRLSKTMKRYHLMEMD
jgi:hypothetical protein